MPVAFGERRDHAPAPIALWSHLIDGDSEVDACWLRMLDEREQTLAAQQPTRLARKRFIIRRAMLRDVLGFSLHRDPAALRFHYGEFGKPALLQDESGLVPGFNMSHSDDLVVLAVNQRGDVGLDVEAIRPLAENVESLFSRHERQQLEALPAAAALHAFYRYWTAKEAVLKLMGTGFSLPPDAVEIADPQDSLRVVAVGGDRAMASAIRLTTLAPLDRFAGAIAAWSTPVVIEHRGWPRWGSPAPSAQPRID